jgi:hypothetical protein
VAAGTAVLLLGAEPVKGAATSVGGASAAAALMPDWHHAVRRQLRFYYLPQISSSTPLTCRIARVEIAHLPLRAAELAKATAAHPRAGAARRRGVYATLSWLAAVLGTARVAAHILVEAARAIHASRSCLAALGAAGRGARWTLGTRAINAVAATALTTSGAGGPIR